MSKPTLIVMAAGMGSRYGGLKQVEPIGPGGEMIIDYSVYDALLSGFGKVIFVIREDIEEVFRQRVGERIARNAQVEYVFQRLEDLPPGFTVPEGRTKPWGAAQAVLCCRGQAEDCAVINADDFYGRETFVLLHDFLATEGAPDEYAMAGYRLGNTLSDEGEVTRGICKVDEKGYLTEIEERQGLRREADGVSYRDENGGQGRAETDSVVSMNAWAFRSGVFNELERGFTAFLRAAGDSQKAEYPLPVAVRDILAAGRCRVKVLPTPAVWYGVTYREDKEQVSAAIRNIIAQGLYPEYL